MTSGITGLTNSQVLERRKQGLGNDVKLSTSRSYKDILMTNVFSAVNTCSMPLASG